MKFCLNNLLFSVSTALDFIERDIMEVVTNHNKRVALVAGKVGYALKMPDKDIFDLISYSLMHDSGAVSLLSKSEPGEFKYELMPEHAILSEETVANFPFLSKRNNILTNHHEHYDGSGIFKKQKGEIHIFSNIIAIGDIFDKLYRADLSRIGILQFLKSKRNTWFAPELVDAFEDVQSKPSFWLDIDDRFIDCVIKNELPVFSIDIGYKEIHNITSILSNIIDLKSKFTSGHSTGISQKVEKMAEYYNYDESKKYQLKIAADLHDVGKLAIPNDILDKNGKLTSAEFVVITSHTYFTRRILENIEHFEDITEWASNHHEKLNGQGYPYGFKAGRLDFCSRLMSVIDIYQALTEHRPYRTGMDHSMAEDILTDMVRSGDLDGDIVADVLKVFAENLES